MSSSQLYNIGIIGCGGIARHHARGFKQLKAARLIACAEVHPKALEEFRAEFEIPHGFSDYREMLDKVELDIVVICTWTGLHAEMTIEAAKCGVRGILCEKPMARSMGEVDAMLQACDANGVKLAIAHQRRVMPVWREAQRMLADGVIGEPQLLYARTYDGMLNSASHLIDAMLFLMQNPKVEWVMGQIERKTDRYERGIPIEDRAIGVFAIEGGARCVVEVDTDRTSAFAVHGTDGMMMPSNNSVRIVSKHSTGVHEFAPAVQADAWMLQAQAMLDWLEERYEHPSAAHYNRAVMEVMMAIYESVRIKGMVRLPLETKDSPLEMMIADGTLPVEKPGKYDIRGYLVRKD